MSISTLTEGYVDGNGVFDVLMCAAKAHLDDQFTQDRITGEEYAKMYTQITTVVMQQAVQYALTEPQMLAQTALIEAQTQNAIVERELLAVQKANAVKDGVNIEKQGLQLDKNLLLTDQQIAQAQQAVSLSEQQESNLLAESANIPLQGAQIEAQTQKITADRLQTTEQTLLIAQQKLNLQAEILNLAKQGEVLDEEILKAREVVKQIAGEVLKIEKERELISSQLLSMAAERLNIPKQGTLLDSQANKVTEDILASTIQRGYVVAQTAMVSKQEDKIDQEIIQSQSNIIKTDKEIAVLEQRRKSEIAQTSDLIDGVAVTGVLGKQKGLYQAQTDGFARDAEQKLTDAMLKAFTVIRTTDEGTVPEIFGFGEASVKSVVDKAKAGINIGV